MPGKTIGISMGVGFDGTISRTADSVVQNRIAEQPIKFGKAVVLSTNNMWNNVSTLTTAAQIAGVAVREVVQANTFNPQSNPDYNANTPCDVLVRGNCTVFCQRGTPVSGAPVYVRIIANVTYPNAVVGGFEASADAANTVLVNNIEWTTGVMDSNSISEITIRSRQRG